MTYTSEVLYSWLNAIEETGRGLSKWEEEFVESVREQLKNVGRLTERQQEILERIYAEKTP